MPLIHRTVASLLLTAAFVHADPTTATTPATVPSDAAAEAAYTQTITKRATDLFDALQLPDSPARDRLRHILIPLLVDRYRELRAWHDENDARLRTLGYRADKEVTAEELGDRAMEIDVIRGTLRSSHYRFVGKLGQCLTPEQIEVVKDRMTYGKLKVTYDAYQEIFPDLTSEQKARIHALLELAREEAMDGGSSEEKSAIFKLYKNRCKAFLTRCGYDVDKAYRDWGDDQKRKAATTRAVVP